MRVFGEILLATLAVTRAAAYVDEQNDAVVIEGETAEESARTAKQLLIAQYASNGLGLSPLLTPPLNQPCLNKEGKLGTCLGLNECYPYFKIFNLGWRDTWVMGHYDTCSYRSPQGDQVFGVCCDQSAPPPVPEEDKNEVKLEELDAVIEDFPIDFQLSDTCGYRTPRPRVTLYDKVPKPFFYIVNGQEAVEHEFPWMAALTNRGRQFCGGSLIDSEHILTAAHCVAHLSKNDVQYLRVKLGDHNIKDNDNTSIEMRVKRVIRHIGFSSKTLHNDIAILTMERAVQFNEYISPICLAAGNNQYVSQRVTVAGWGTLTDRGRQPNELMKVDVEVWTNDRCRNSYGSNAPGGITSHMLCASLPDKDSCSGDSGGPLFRCGEGSNGLCTQVGIVSWGIGCAQANYPGVYTRVTSMREWINTIVSEY
jgi:V8-like Glu-specific endopeptidase